MLVAQRLRLLVLLGRLGFPLLRVLREFPKIRAAVSQHRHAEDPLDRLLDAAAHLAFVAEKLLVLLQ